MAFNYAAHPAQLDRLPKQDLVENREAYILASNWSRLPNSAERKANCSDHCQRRVGLVAKRLIDRFLHITGDCADLIGGRIGGALKLACGCVDVFLRRACRVFDGAFNIHVGVIQFIAAL